MVQHADAVGDIEAPHIDFTQVALDQFGLDPAIREVGPGHLFGIPELHPDQAEGIAAGGVIPGFTDHKHAITAEEYIDAVRRGDILDPTLSFQLDQGFEAVCALPNYVDNPKVDHYAVFIVWHNPDHAAPRPRT